MTVPTPQPRPVPVGQPVNPVDFYRRIPGGGTQFIRPPADTVELPGDPAMTDEIPPAAALDAAASAVVNYTLGAEVYDTFADFQRAHWRKAMDAARPHLTAAKDAEITRLRQYAAATKYHQDQHATAVRELEPLKATVAEALALLERFDTPGDRRRVEALLFDLRHVLTDKSSPSAPAQEGQTT